MISEKMKQYAKDSSVIREMFEAGKRLAAVHGAENVYDFSLGNPNIKPPAKIKEYLREVIDSEEENLHGYMNNSGYEFVRKAVADSLNRRFDTDFDVENIIMSNGAGGGLNVIFKTLLNPGDEVITFAPYFGEYRNYVSNFDGVLKVVAPNIPSFEPDLDELEGMITSKTKCVLINSPNNPTGVVYGEKVIRDLAELLERKQKEFGQAIYLISDEPYRELVYDGIEVPFPTKYYDNTLIGYSFSKSLSIPGERIGYIVVPSEASDFDDMVSAMNIATRTLGFINAPALFQRVIAKCLDLKVDIDSYNANRELLYRRLTEFGLECVKPEGAFYMFVQSPYEDEVDFCQKAKEKNILLVPGRSFGCEGYVRIAYCVSHEMIERSLPAFKELMDDIRSQA